MIIKSKMPTHIKWKLSSSKKKAKVFSSKSKRTITLRPWDDSITDLSVYSSTPEEVKQRHLAHRSNNLEIAKMELLEKKIPKYKNTNDLEANKGSNYKKSNDEQKCTAVPFVTLAPKPSEMESTVSSIINEDYRNIRSCPDSGRIIDESTELRSTNCKMENSIENYYSPSLNATELEEVLLYLQRKLQVGEKNEVDAPISFSKSENYVSGFTYLFLNTLDKLSHKCIKACEELSIEKRKRKELQGEVEKLKHKVTTLMQDMVSLQTTISEINDRPKIYNSEISWKDNNQQSHTSTCKISSKDHSASISNSTKPSSSDKAQHSFYLQNLDNSVFVNTSKISDTCNDSERSNNYSCYDSCNLNQQQSQITAVMLRPPVQLNMIHRHHNA